MLTKQVGLKLEPDLHERVERQARREYVSPATFARKAVAVYVTLAEAGIPTDALLALANVRKANQ
jgi:predicted transcriptional regulator